MLAQRVKGWEYDKEQYDLKPHVVLDNQMYHDNKPVYKVFSKIKTENKQGEERPYATFGQYGGLYVTQDDRGEGKPLDIINQLLDAGARFEKISPALVHEALISNLNCLGKNVP